MNISADSKFMFLNTRILSPMFREQQKMEPTDGTVTSINVGNVLSNVRICKTIYMQIIELKFE